MTVYLSLYSTQDLTSTKKQLLFVKMWFLQTTVINNKFSPVHFHVTSVTSCLCLCSTIFLVYNFIVREIFYKTFHVSFHVLIIQFHMQHWHAQNTLLVLIIHLENFCYRFIHSYHRVCLFVFQISFQQNKIIRYYSLLQYHKLPFMIVPVTDELSIQLQINFMKGMQNKQLNKDLSNYIRIM